VHAARETEVENRPVARLMYVTYFKGNPKEIDAE